MRAKIAKFRLLILILLGSSGAVNVWLILKVLDYKGRVFLARQFPDPVPIPVVVDERSQLWLIGDSRVQAWFPGDTPERKVINRGISGFTVKDTLEQLRSDLSSGHKPSTIVIQVGINDILSAGYNRPSRLPAGAFNGWPDRPGPAAIMGEAFRNLEALVNISLKSQRRVVIFTVFPPGPLGLRDRFFWSSEMDEWLAELNQKIIALKDKGILVCDSSSAISQAGRVKSVYSKDALHLNAAGYEVLTAELESILSHSNPGFRP